VLLYYKEVTDLNAYKKGHERKKPDVEITSSDGTVMIKRSPV